jgi:hypothetical protein
MISEGVVIIVVVVVKAKNVENIFFYNIYNF